MATQSQVTTKTFSDFSGGVNLYLGPRQVADNESPNAVNCDFKGRGGVGNRSGYTKVGTAGSYSSGVFGLAEYHTSNIDQLVKFASNGSLVGCLYNTGIGSSWNVATGNTFTNNKDINVVQAVSAVVAANVNNSFAGANGTLFTFNGADAMQTFDGTTVAAYAPGATLLYGAYYDNRLWGVDPTYRDTLKFSTKTPDATKPLDFGSTGTSSDKGTLNFTPGSGAEIVGLKVFKSSLYVFTRKEIYAITPSSTANFFNVTLVTASIGCVSHRSICTIENDIYFASDIGIYTIGDVATFTSVRGNNRSLRIQTIYSGLTGETKSKLVGRYFNYKYHLFYSATGNANDSCAVYDIRYQAWHSWTNIAADDATIYISTSKTTTFYFGHPASGDVYNLYNGATDDGTIINSAWYSKSFDFGAPDTLKLFFYTDYVFGSLSGSVTVTDIFNDQEIIGTAPIFQPQPNGGFGNALYGRVPFGGGLNTNVVTPVVNQPKRLKAKAQRYAIQYNVVSTGSWRLDSIGQALMMMTPWKTISTNKLN